MSSKFEYIGQSPRNDNVKSVLERVLEENGFTDCRIDIKPLGDKGDNFIAELYTADVEGVNGRTLNVVIKIGQENEDIRRLTLTPVCFKNEILTYTETLPIYEEIQSSCNIDQDKRYKFAKCYGHDLKPGQECILLENLKVQGYTMEDRLEAQSYEYIKAAVENLAKYHALSFIFREKYEEKYKSVVDTMRDFFSIHARNAAFIKNMRNRIERATLTVDDKDHRERVRNTNDKIEDLLLNSHKPWSDRTCVINHGDSWLNNVLFRTKSGSQLDAIMIDYQLAKHSSPVLDILYFIFLSTDSEFREQYFDTLKNAYYNSLSNFLKDLGYEAANFYTRDQMEHDIRKYSPYTLGLAVLILPVIAAEKGDTPDLTKPTDLIPEIGNAASRYDKKMSDAIRDFVKHKFI